MKLTVQELNVIIDTLLGSARLVDDMTAASMFTYTASAREALAKRLINRASEIEIGIDTNESGDDK